MSEASISRVLLVGFMGAGKSTVGALVAGRLGWRFVDVDAEVERVAGRSVAEIFAGEGEASFRAMEARTAAQILQEDEVVIAAGGGWAAVPGRLAEVGEGTLSVWLEVGPKEAVRRASGHPGTRPLLARDRPLEAARELLERRVDAYAAAQHRVDTDALSVEDVSARILEILQEIGIEPRTE